MTDKRTGYQRIIQTVQKSLVPKHMQSMESKVTKLYTDRADTLSEV